MSQEKPTLITIPDQKWDNTTKSIGWDEERISQLKIMVVGAGALGNEVLKNLALLNVGHILIVDYDHIEYANLAKSVLYRAEDCGPDKLKSEVAAQKIREINPQVKVMSVNGDVTSDVGLGVFARMDAVIGCLDNRLARLMVNRQCFKVGKPWVDGAIQNLAGELTVFVPGTSCYECNLTTEEWEGIKVELGCFAVAMSNISIGRIPTTPISSSIIAAMEVQEALKLAMGNREQSLAGRKFIYEGMHNTIQLFDIDSSKEGCFSHFEYSPTIKMKALSGQTRLTDALDMLATHFGVEDPAIKLDSEVILELVTTKSSKSIPVILPKSKFNERNVGKYRVHEEDEVRISNESGKVVKYLDRKFPHQDATLAEIGIPPLQILRVIIEGESKFVELTGDEGFLQFV